MFKDMPHCDAVKAVASSSDIFSGAIISRSKVEEEKFLAFSLISIPLTSHPEFFMMRQNAGTASDIQKIALFQAGSLFNDSSLFHQHYLPDKMVNLIDNSFRGIGMRNIIIRFIIFINLIFIRIILSKQKSA